jgi:hypothetical protein
MCWDVGLHWEMDEAACPGPGGRGGRRGWDRKGMKEFEIREERGVRGGYDLAFQSGRSRFEG